MSIPTSGPFADQNLTALFPKLMKFTPQQLSQVQGVPGWFLASVLGAQQAERNNGAQTTPPTQTVVQQVIDKAVGAPPAGQAMPASPAPTQMASHGGYIHDYGVASLPYEAHYGHGGIVSFDNGGSTADEAAFNKRRTPEEMANIKSGLADYALNKRRTPEEMANIKSGLAAYYANKKSTPYAPDTGLKSEEDVRAKEWVKNNPDMSKSLYSALLIGGLEGNRQLKTILPAIPPGVLDAVNTYGKTWLTIAATSAFPTLRSMNPTPQTPVAPAAPPGDTREAFTNPDALGMANPDPVDFPAEEPAEDPAATDPTLGAQPVYGPPGGIPSLGNYPGFTPQELPPEYDLKIEAEKQAKANERFGVDPNYSKNELAKNAAQIQKTKQDAIDVFSGEALSSLGIALANNHSGKGLLSGIAEAAPEYAAATREGIESARTRTDLLDTRGELLRGQEQERNVGRADAAFADQKKREAEIRAAENANRTGENNYNIDRFTAMAERQDRTSALAAQFAQITENARQFAISSLQASQKIAAESNLALATLERTGAEKETLAAAKLKADMDANATTMIKAFSADYVKLMAGVDSSKYPPEGQQAYVDVRMANYIASMNPVTSITTGNDNTGGIGALRPGARGMDAGKASRGLYTPPSLRNP
jgi:hypothetical protein